jgi:single-stranded-DNA-specific exonuclease
MQKRWLFKPLPPKELVLDLSSLINVNYTLSSILIQRGVKSFEEAKNFFRPTLENLHDPFLMADMEKAVERIEAAIRNKENILIYGDYDVDGTTSVALVYSFLKEFYFYLEYYIPDRYNEGYGLSKAGIEHAHNNNISLIICLDCGIKETEVIGLANEYGIDVIVCDHHRPGNSLPPAYAVLDPKREDCRYPYKELSGCGVGFKLLQAFCIKNEIPLERIYRYLDLVAVSIASDIVPVTGENRILAFFGLQKINSNPGKGIKSIIKNIGLKTKLDIGSVVFTIGPRINAAGRISHATSAVKLLIAESDNDADILADIVDNNNNLRKEFDLSITNEAIEMIANNPDAQNLRSTVLFKNDWHKGVIGIVASRCIEKHYKPTIILTESNQKATGSARSVLGFDIYEAIAECAELLEKFGGHTHAAGLTMELSNVPAFQQKFEQVVKNKITEESLVPVLEIDQLVNFDFINYKTYNILKQMGPFGPNNMQPVFVTENVYAAYPPRILKGDHLKMVVQQEGLSYKFDTIGFGLAKFYDEILLHKKFRLAYTIEENDYMNKRNLQLCIKDIKFD